MNLKKVTAGKKQIKVSWKKAAGTKYQVQIATNKKFTNAKTVTISRNTTLKATLGNLNAAKTYYVRVRTYKTVKVSGKSVKLYSGWSSVKSVKTK